MNESRRRPYSPTMVRYEFHDRITFVASPTSHSGMYTELFIWVLLLILMGLAAHTFVLISDNLNPHTPPPLGQTS